MSGSIFHTKSTCFQRSVPAGIIYASYWVYKFTIECLTRFIYKIFLGDPTSSLMLTQITVASGKNHIVFFIYKILLEYSGDVKEGFANSDCPKQASMARMF